MIGIDIFRCPNCGQSITLPLCNQCGANIPVKNGVYQLTDDENAKVDSNDDENYVGYDDIGEFYGGRRWIECTASEMTVGAFLADQVKSSVMLDIGCGHGLHTVPAAIHRATVIAADISNRMVELLLKKASQHNVNIESIIPCRMNALSIMLVDSSIGLVVANSVLHLISRPKVVLHEIHRVLNDGGKLVLFGNSPALKFGHDSPENAENQEYISRTNEFYGRYWKLLDERNVQPIKYNWRFDQVAACQELFSSMEEICLSRNEHHSVDLYDGFLYRLKGRGFSDQYCVDPAVHEEVFDFVYDEFVRKYGDAFSHIKHHELMGDIVLNVYTK